MVENIAIIPARGGSKGIPKKNIIEVCGRPLIEYTINAAQSAKTVQRIIVSTDDDEIATISKDIGAEIVMRPSGISGDFASSESALIHALNNLLEQERYEPDLLTFLQCTSPLTTADDIDGTVNLILNGYADSSFAAAPFHYYLWAVSNDGSVRGINHSTTSRPMRQEREQQFLEAGSVYAMKVRQFQESQFRFFGKTCLFEIPEENCFEIDEPADLPVAAAILKSRGF